jgi:hypothetical protein
MMTLPMSSQLAAVAISLMKPLSHLIIQQMAEIMTLARDCARHSDDNGRKRSLVRA